MVKTAFNQRLKFRLIVLLLVTTSVLVIYGLYLLSGVATNIKKSRVKVAETNRDISLLDKALEDKRQYGSDIQKVKSTLPSEYYQVSFFTTQLERLAQNNNLTLQINIDQKMKDEKASYNSVVYSLEIVGSYSAVSQFLSQLAKLPYNTSIDYMKMTNEEGHLNTEVKFRLFVEQ